MEVLGCGKDNYWRKCAGNLNGGGGGGILKVCANDPDRMHYNDIFKNISLRKST